jgi:hypothetical protein
MTGCVDHLQIGAEAITDLRQIRTESFVKPERHLEPLGAGALATATTMYREMGMTYWLDKGEKEMKASG